MNPLRSGCRMCGYAMAEALLALAAIAILLHGMAVLGGMQRRGLQAAQLGRHAAFAAARGQTDVPGWLRAAITTGRSASTDAHLQAGNAAAVALARDWLQADPRLRYAAARVHAQSGAAFVHASEPAAMLPVRGHTAIAQNAGHAYGSRATAARLSVSAMGWHDAALASQRAAQALHRKLQPVDAPWGRGAWTTDWLTPWADLSPSAAGR